MRYCDGIRTATSLLLIKDKFHTIVERQARQATIIRTIQIPCPANLPTRIIPTPSNRIPASQIDLILQLSPAWQEIRLIVQHLHIKDRFATRSLQGGTTIFQHIIQRHVGCLDLYEVLHARISAKIDRLNLLCFRRSRNDEICPSGVSKLSASPVIMKCLSPRVRSMRPLSPMIQRPLGSKKASSRASFESRRTGDLWDLTLNSFINISLIGTLRDTSDDQPTDNHLPTVA